jgi:hypothetical protein
MNQNIDVRIAKRLSAFLCGHQWVLFSVVTWQISHPDILKTIEKFHKT